MDESLTSPSENKTPLYIAAGALVLAAGSLLWAYGINKKVNAKTDELVAMRAYVDEKIAGAQASDALNAVQAQVSEIKASQAAQEVLNEDIKKGLRQASEAYVKLLATVNTRPAGGTRTAQTGGTIGNATVSQVGAGGEYKVVSGDNFSKIARKYGVTLGAIEAANPGVSSSNLKVGQTIKIPAKQ